MAPTPSSPGLAILQPDGTVIDRANARDIIDDYNGPELLPEDYADDPGAFFAYMSDQQIHDWTRTLPDGESVNLKGIYLDDRAIMLVADTEDSEGRFMEMAFYQAIEQSGHGVLVTDPSGTILYANPQIEENTGYTRSEMIGQTPALFQSDYHDDAFYDAMWAKIQNGETWSGENINKRKDGELYVINETIAPIMDPDGTIMGYVGVNYDVTKRWTQRRRLEQQAHQDPTLEIATHEFMMERIEDLRDADGESFGTLVLLSLDNYSMLEESMGPRAINLAIESVLEQAREHSHGQDLISKLSDSEILLFSNQHGPDEVQSFVEGLSSSLQSTVNHKGETYDLDLSVGATARALGDVESGELLDEADMARLAARKTDGERYRIYDPDKHADMRTDAIESMRLSRALKRAVDQRQFCSYYQPLIDLESGRVSGFEALLRWDHPEEGILTPGSFIEQARTDGLLQTIERQVMRRSCEVIGELNDDRDRSLTLNLNIEPGQFQDPEFPTALCSTVNDTPLQPSNVCIEIVESKQLRNEAALQQLNRIKKRGFGLAIDDFGTGFSSLDYLIKIPADTVKIDRGLISELDAEAPANPVLFAVVSMIRNLDKRIVAEGIETPFQHQNLTGMNVNTGQGFLYAKPMPFEDCHDFLENHDPDEPFADES